MPRASSRSRGQGLHVAARTASDIDDRALDSVQESMVDVVCLGQPALDIKLAAGPPVEADSGSQGQERATH